MSKVGKLPVEIPTGVTITQDGYYFVVKGPKGELSRELNEEMLYEISDKEIVVKRETDSVKHRSLHGLTRSLLNNMVEGVTTGFSKSLEIIGVGFRAEMKGNALLLHLGYSHPILFMPPSEISVETPSQTEIKVSGINKELVGMVAAKLRSLRKPEPYKGKGVRYKGEQIKRKAGKSGKA